MPSVELAHISVCRRLHQHPTLRYFGLRAHATVKATRPPHSALELGARNSNPFLACVRIIGRADPADPVPARHGCDFLPELLCLRDGRKTLLDVRRHHGVRPFFDRFDRQGCRLARVYAHGFVRAEPVASFAVRFERHHKAGTMDGPLGHRHASRWKLQTCVFWEPHDSP